jgi:casein kinase 1
MVNFHNIYRQNNRDTSKMSTDILNNRYTIQEEIKKGGFGSIYKGFNIKTGKNVAIKTENQKIGSSLKHETKILRYLCEQGSRYTPIVYWFGRYKENLVLVIPLYEYSLYEKLQETLFSMEMAIQITEKTMKILEFIHGKYVIHRDIKPQNIMIQNGEPYLIDFGLATFYIDENNNHIENKGETSLIGSLKYISHNIHEGNTPSRRDDLISLGYIFIMLYTGELPWREPTYENKNKFYKQMKEDNIISKYFKYCNELEFKETPNYGRLLSSSNNRNNTFEYR